jgi:hypothetical protein
MCLPYYLKNTLAPGHNLKYARPMAATGRAGLFSVLYSLPAAFPYSSTRGKSCTYYFV